MRNLALFLKYDGTAILFPNSVDNPSKIGKILVKKHSSRSKEECP